MMVYSKLMKDLPSVFKVLKKLWKALLSQNYQL